MLLGSSGAGKSTLTNTLTSSQQETGGVREGDSRGRHTTTARSLHQSISGACIIDTPGLRTWSPDIDEESLGVSFDDIQQLADNCRFRECHHESEPGCAVRDHVDADRLQNYRKLYARYNAVNKPVRPYSSTCKMENATQSCRSARTGKT